MTLWSGFTNHLRIGADWWTDPYDTYTPSINVYIQISVGVDATWNFNDSQTVNLSGSAGASWTFQNTMGANGIAAIGTAVIGGQGQSYGGGPTYSFHAQLDGVYLGAGPALDFSFPLPARPIRPPGAPTAPGYGSITATSVVVGWAYSGDNGGSGLDADWLQLATDAGFGTIVYSNIGGINLGRGVSGLTPGTTYYGRAAAHNAAGWSGWSGTSSVTLLPGANAQRGGAWQNGVPEPRRSGAFVGTSNIYKRRNGAWVIS